MVNQYNGRNYANPGPPGQRRQTLPAASQPPSGSRQMPVGRVGGSSQPPQHYQQQTAPPDIQTPNIEQSQYTHHSQSYQGSYGEGMQGVRDAEMNPSSAAPNDMHVPDMNFPEEIFQELHENDNMEKGQPDTMEKKTRKRRRLSDCVDLLYRLVEMTMEEMVGARRLKQADTATSMITPDQYMNPDHHGEMQP